jgi:hypothetical protein
MRSPLPQILTVSPCGLSRLPRASFLRPQTSGAKALWPPPLAVNDGFWLPSPACGLCLGRGSHPKIL